ncbi:MAG: hypothetical protein RBR79_00620 [Bacteroidales bacterium]|nr:hypothetical protein [Bacteroidales bacterium]
MNQFQEKLKLTIEEIKQLTDRIISNKDISQIEIDILLSKLRDTYSLCLGFDNKEEEREFEIKEEMPKEIIELVEVFELEKTEDVEEEEIEEEIEGEEVEEEEIIEEEIEEKEEEEEVKEVILEKKTPSVLKYLNENMPKSMNFAFEEKPLVKEEAIEKVVEEIVESVKEEVKTESPKTTTLGEKYQNQASLFESMSNKTEKNDINSKLNQSRADLRTAIGVHEKFMFINDLFSGNLREYTEFIQNLNAAENLDNAKDIIREVKEKKRWITTSLPYTTLENVVERKFKK